MRRLNWIAALSCLLLMMDTVCALADGERLGVRRADGVGSEVMMWEKSDGQMYLFLPAYMEGQTLTLRYEGVDSVRLGEMDIASGSQTDAIAAGASLTLHCDGESESLVVMQSANLPAVHLTTQSGSLDYIHDEKGNKEEGTVQIVTADGSVDFAGMAKAIKGHGNATFIYDKKSYQVKLEDEASILGMGEGKTYVLLANQHENTLLRNRITFDLARGAGLRYTSECRSVDLYINGEYRGSYLLCDKVAVSAGSVQVTNGEEAIRQANAPLVERDVTPSAYGTNKYAKGTHKGVAWPEEPADVTGGYLFELEYKERYKDEVSGVVTDEGQAVVVKEPEEMTKAQGEYVAALLGSFERAIFAKDGVDAQTGRHYTEIADLTSLVRKYMIEEISKNYDGNKSSQYFYKDSDSVDPLIYAGPVWDYDSAWGNFAREDNLSFAEPTGLYVAREGASYSWWPALTKQPDFAAAVTQAWEAVYKPMLNVLIGEWAAPADSAVKSLDVYAQELSASAEMNFARWRVLNHSSRAVKTGASYGENIEYLRSWIRGRMAYLDEKW